MNSITLLFLSQNRSRDVKKSNLYSRYSENRSCKTSLFTNEVPVHGASHLQFQLPQWNRKGNPDSAAAVSRHSGEADAAVQCCCSSLWTEQTSALNELLGWSHLYADHFGRFLFDNAWRDNGVFLGGGKVYSFMYLCIDEFLCSFLCQQLICCFCTETSLEILLLYISFFEVTVSSLSTGLGSLF